MDKTSLSTSTAPTPSTSSSTTTTTITITAAPAPTPTPAPSTVPPSAPEQILTTSTTSTTSRKDNKPDDRPTHNYRFTQQNETLEDVLKSQTVGLVHLSEFKKRRVELLEAKEREAATPNTSRAASVGSDGSGRQLKKKRKKGPARGMLSFEDEDTDSLASSAAATPEPEKRKVFPNPTVATPTVITKATLQKEAETRQNLRREFNKLQEQIKNEEVTIPFVFYDGTNVPGGECKMKKGEAVWLFLERARRTRGLWHRVSVDDLMFVRGEIIIPHHYELYYFIANRTIGPHGMLFDYSSPLSFTREQSEKTEKAPEDPTTTKVVDRRWYERNKHIFPASMWEMFDPARDYTKLVRRDRSENAFFFT